MCQIRVWSVWGPWALGGGGSGGLRTPPSWAVCAGPSQGGGRRGRQLPPGPQGARDPKCGVRVGGLEASPASPVHDLSSKVASWSFERSPPEPSRPVPAVPSVSRRVRSGVSREWDPMPCGPCVRLLSTCQARGFRGACPCRPGWSASSCLFLNRRTSGRFYPLAVVNPANARPDFSADADAHFSQGCEVIRAGFERAGGWEARKLTRKRCVSRPTAWRLQGSCVPATPRRPQGRGCTGLHRAAPARPARPRGQACSGLSYVQHLQQDTYTLHKTIFYRAFGFTAILRGKHRVCPWTPALTAGSPPRTPHRVLHLSRTHTDASSSRRARSVHGAVRPVGLDRRGIARTCRSVSHAVCSPPYRPEHTVSCPCRVRAQDGWPPTAKWDSAVR
ncbi:uncharacterized protein LOC121022850 isoform X1 [Herpailurus yagouaroundi]|uniref:uncharacterized protein LOC121022850 isoform X1 n=1 Tax=Herpailurus yagouaroundi TaxID=1608482 RepID=UPI001AD68383|nr:uncharacterized protein LOC121022850 isoform X1 [Puma yagouaroundi]